jgi:hypothetical protein
VGSRPAVAAAVAAVLVVAGWAGGEQGAKVSPAQLLRRAKATLDSTHAVHFELQSRNVARGGTDLIGGEGDAVRPDKLRGSFRVTVDGLPATVKVAAVGKAFEAELPFSDHYSRVDPAALGLGAPSQLLSPKTGVSGLLTAGAGVRFAGQERIAGELLDVVTARVAGSTVRVLPNASPGKPVRLVAAVDPRNSELRQLALTGHFTSPTGETTYQLRLTGYGESVSVTLPPA